MSSKEQISRLEELLARVQQRAAEPRAMAMAAAQPMPSQISPKATTAAMPATPAMPMNGGAPSVQPPTPATPRVSEPPAAALPSTPPMEASFPSSPPMEASNPSAPPVASRPSTIPPITTVDDDSSDVDVEVSTEVVDIDVDVDVDDMGMPLESGAQPVADHAFADDHTMHEPTMTDAEVPVLEPIPEEVPPAQALANEIEEPAPSSSPRRVASEKPEAFEEESAPRHTPPPESGKQVAAAPSAQPPPRRTSNPPPSESPPSLEGHTLIGGWREPGLGGAPIIGAPGAGPGVRVPAPGQAAPPPAPPAAAAMPPEPITATRASVPPRHSDRPLSPEVTRAELPGAGTKVASFEGAAPSFKPSSFGDLLDASLGL